MKKNKIIKLISKIFSKDFLKYLLVGSSSVLLDLITLFVFVKIFKISSTLAVVINQIIIYNYVFFLNKIFVFQAKGNLLRQIFRYCQLAVVNYGIAVCWMYFFVEICQQNYLLSRLFNIILATGWNFLVYRGFIYKKKVNKLSIDNYG